MIPLVGSLPGVSRSNMETGLSKGVEEDNDPGKMHPLDALLAKTRRIGPVTDSAKCMSFWCMP